MVRVMVSIRRKLKHHAGVNTPLKIEHRTMDRLLRKGQQRQNLRVIRKIAFGLLNVNVSVGL